MTGATVGTQLDLTVAACKPTFTKTFSLDTFALTTAIIVTAGFLLATLYRPISGTYALPFFTPTTITACNFAFSTPSPLLTGKAREPHITTAYPFNTLTMVIAGVWAVFYAAIFTRPA